MICKSIAARKINVSDAIAGLDEGNDGSVSQVDTMAKVNVVQILSQTTDRRYGAVGDVSAFGEYEIP